MEIKKVKISKIKLNPNNPRFIRDDQFERLCKSLKEFPEMAQLREVVVDENMVILGGNMRFRAMKENGEKEVVVKIADGLSEQQKREFIIKDNSGFGSWDFEMLANDFGELPLEDWGLDISGMETAADLEPENLDSLESDNLSFSAQIVSIRNKIANGMKEPAEEKSAALLRAEILIIETLRKNEYYSD
jgi:hypothetical protein